MGLDSLGNLTLLAQEKHLHQIENNALEDLNPCITSFTTMTKRKSAHAVPDRVSVKKRPGSRLNPANAVKPGAEADKIKASFAESLFEGPVKDGYRDFYATSEPCVP